ncbi:MAG: ATP-dependent sacrificial sulfur transferase LarE [Candidatus Omnitrophota bacterium]
MINNSANLKQLQDILRRMESVVVAYSGGVDSTFLLKLAKDTLHNNVIAVTAVSETYPQKERIFAAQMTKELRVRHIFIKTHELKNENFNKNPVNRCYFCKKELFKNLKCLAKEKNICNVVDAATVDDLKDFRPGRIAGKEMGIRSPLMEAHFTKNDVRIFSKRLRLCSWNKPSMACLASRLPYGQKITKSKLKMIEHAEEYLKNLGFFNVRVRNHNNLARIEVAPEKLKTIFKYIKQIIFRFKKIGFDYITIDLEGFRSGSMNIIKTVSRYGNFKKSYQNFPL